MFSIPKIAVTGLALLSFAMSAQVVRADGHEQARQLLQRSDSRTTVKALAPVSATVAVDGQEQARRMIVGSSAGTEPKNVRYARALVAKPEGTADGQARARRLLDRNLVTREPETPVRRSGAVAVK
jgi:hypothetical protein